MLKQDFPKVFFKKGLRFSSIYLSRFLDVSAADTDPLLTPLIPSPKGGGEVLFDDNPGSSLPHGVEALLGQGLACQLPLDGLEQEEVLEAWRPWLQSIPSLW